MKLVLISDTHSLHRNLILPKGDIIIHAGDITDRGTKKEVVDFLDWFSDLDYEHHIFIGGNHDAYLDDNTVDLLDILPSNVTYLNNNATQINKLKFWGSPVSPDVENWAFGKPRSDMEEHWKYMPTDIDVLITHTPPYGILDKSSQRYSLGCRFLLRKIAQMNISHHIFGHVHASYGMCEIGRTTFINASNLNSYKGLINPAILVDL